MGLSSHCVASGGKQSRCASCARFIVAIASAFPDTTTTSVPASSTIGSISWSAGPISRDLLPDFRAKRRLVEFEPWLLS